jgi:hypothetical protein
MSKGSGPEGGGQAPEKVLDRIRKLYNMSKESVASPHEAEIALRRCQALMSRYGVTEADLETSEFGVASAFRIRKQMPTYVSVLASSTGLLHDCIVIKNQEGLEFRGYAIDTQVSQMTFEYLSNTLERLLSQAKRSGEIGAGRSASHDFRVGFALEVYGRCKEIDRERRANKLVPSSSGTSIVVQKMQMVNANCAKNIGKARPKKVVYRDSDANTVGRQAGATVSLGSQIDGGAGAPIVKIRGD